MVMGGTVMGREGWGGRMGRSGLGEMVGGGEGYAWERVERDWRGIV